MYINKLNINSPITNYWANDFFKFYSIEDLNYVLETAELNLNSDSFDKDSFKCKKDLNINNLLKNFEFSRFENKLKNMSLKIYFFKK